MIQHTNTHRHSTQSGFTLIELILATSFIAFILIFMLTTMINVMSNYNKGLAVKQINQTARTVTDEMGRLIQNTNTSGMNTSRIANGRVCLGGVSYVWNVRNTTTNQFTTTGEPLRFVRVNDPGGSLCGATLPNVNRANASEMLSSQIWVQQLNVVVSSNQKLVDITIGLSTAAPNQPTGTDAVLGTICDGGKDSQYCAISTFRTTVATKNGGG